MVYGMSSNMISPAIAYPVYMDFITLKIHIHNTFLWSQSKIQPYFFMECTGQTGLEP